MKRLLLRSFLQVALTSTIYAVSLPAQSAVERSATGTLTGTVISSATEQPLAGAQVFIPSIGVSTTVLADGRYTIPDIPPGTYTVGVQLIGFGLQERTVTVGASSTARLDFRLTNEAVSLDELVITNSRSTATTLPVRPVSGVFGFEVSVVEAPRSIFQINPQQIQNDVITSVSDLARYTPSVNQATGNLENYGTPNLRGAQGDAYQNGVRLITRPGNNRPFTTNAYEGADLVAGPAPIIFGPSARTAGYVNYITKKPYFDRQRGTATWSGGKWYGDDTGFKPQNTLQVDIGGPILENRLAYRLSYEGTSRDHYYDDRTTKYNQIYGMLGWLPDERTAVDLNFEIGEFDWHSNNFQNRVTNELIRNRTYLGGPATPIIQVGSAFYSPVLNAAGDVTGWQTRTRVVNPDGTNGFTAGDYVSDPTGPTTAQAGTIVGYVLDPELVKEVKLSANVGLNAPGYSSNTKATNAQLRINRILRPGATVANNSTYQYYQTNNPGNGGFHNWIRAQVFENRTELLLRNTFQILGQRLEHQSNTGVSFRWEPNRNYKDGQRAGYGPTGDQYDLTAPASTFTRNAFFGATVYPFEGTVNDPVLTRFGYLKGFWGYLPVPESPGDYNTPGGTGATDIGTLASQTYDTTLRTYSVFAQERFDFGRLVLDLGGRWSYLSADIFNPLPSPLVEGNDTIGDSITETNVNFSSSLSYRIGQSASAYVAYSRVEAVNGNTSGAVAWPRTALDRDRGPNKFSSRDFNSVSTLKEVGAKFEPIRNRLFLTSALFEQTRLLTLSLPAGFTDPQDAEGLYRGVELGIRYQPASAVFIGANYSYLDATVQNSTYSTGAPVVADNFTNLLSNTTPVLADYRVTNLPKHVLSLFGNYQLSNGIGLRSDASIRDAANVDNAGTITVPGYLSANVGAYYDQPRYRISFDIQNVTNEHRRAGGSTPLEPISAQARIAFKF